MVGSVKKRNSRKHWSRSLHNPGSRAVDAERRVAGFSGQNPEAAETSTLDCALQQKVRGVQLAL